jgi:uncharacterized protein YacL
VFHGALEYDMMKVFIAGVAVIICVVGAAMNPQILGDIRLPTVSLSNTYQLTLISCAAVATLNLGYFLSAVSKIVKEVEERINVSQLHVYDIKGRGDEPRGENAAS